MRTPRRAALPLSLALAACGADASSDTTAAADTEVAPDADALAADAPATDDADAGPTELADATPPAAWDPEPGPVACAADRPAPLLDAALVHAGLTRDTFGFSPADYASSRYFAEGHLDDAYLLSWFRPTQARAADAACFGADVAGRLDALAAGPHPVAAMIRHAARLLERWPDGDPGPTPARASADLGAALAGAHLAAGLRYEPPSADLGLPADLAGALVPVVDALADALEAHRLMVESTSYATADVWLDKGGIGIAFSGQFSLLTKSAVRDYLLGAQTRPALNLAAARLAFAVEAVDWARFRGRAGVRLDLTTPLGRVVVNDASAHTYPAPVAGDPPVMLLLDLGGDDVHRDDVGANTHGSLGVNLAIDLGGADDYGYEPHPGPDDPEWLLPADDHGRYAASDQNGPLSASRHARQGAARNGVALLFDLGGGDDRYASLAHSQGYAHLGVGVLVDDGGDDTYVAETASQGAAAYGIGLLVDLGQGSDTRRIVANGQGSANVAGAGFAFDGGGDDVWWADPGLADHGGHALVYSPQMAGQGNTSMAQGAATGVRWDAQGLFLSGGLGVLRDAGGDDTYTASLFAQGSGYWQGTGILSDGGGADTYDALYYVQGGGAHYAMSLLLDGGPGDDRMNQTLPPQYMQMGSGHDFTLGVLVNEAGDDTYRFAGLAVGSSNCNGVGLFVDNGGDDAYTTTSDYGGGMGNVSGECLAARPDAVSIGVMIDAGGTDSYTWPMSEHPTPLDDSTWGHRRNDLPSEHGAGVDGQGETGIHAP